MWLRGIRCTFGNSLLDDANVVHAGYFKSISKIARQERAKLYIPVSAPTTAIYDSLTQDVLPKDCVCWTLPPHLTGLLDDKTAFTDLCNKVSRSVMCELACIRHAVLQAPARQALLNLKWLLQCFLSRALSICAQALPPFLPSPLPTHSPSLLHEAPPPPLPLLPSLCRPQYQHTSEGARIMLQLLMGLCSDWVASAKLLQSGVITAGARLERQSAETRQ